jgi:PIN domain nuclease of toxin-antitoxin system
MRLLLDTHALLWLAHEPDKLSSAMLETITSGDHEIIVSAVSAMEIWTKQRSGKLEYQSTLATHFVREVTAQGFVPLSISCAHMGQAGDIVSPHKDPWDRILAAQALTEELTLATVDTFFAEIGVATYW